MTKAMEDALRLFLLHWMEARELELESRMTGLGEVGETGSKLRGQLAETKRISCRLAEEHYKQGGHNAG